MTKQKKDAEWDPPPGEKQSYKGARRGPKLRFGPEERRARHRDAVKKSNLKKPRKERELSRT